MEVVEERFGQVDAALQQADTREWEQRNEQRRLAAASQSTTPAKGAAAVSGSCLKTTAAEPCQASTAEVITHIVPLATTRYH